jgi:hypothetical protein
MSSQYADARRLNGGVTMSDDQVLIDRAVLVDIDQFLLRLGDYPGVIRAIEESLDCGDFYNHIQDHLARAIDDQPRPTLIT